MVKSVITEMSYSKYKTLMKSSAKKIGEALGTEVIIEPTPKIICKKIGINKEAANGLNTIKFLKAVYAKLKEKGYEIPNLFLSEEQLPRKYNTTGLQIGNWNIFGPGSLDVTNPSLVIHECAHFLHKKNMPWNQPFYALICSIKNCFQNFLNKKEKEIFIKDIKRAYNEGFYKDLELENCVKKGFINKNTIDEFQKTPEKFLAKNAFKNVSEFIAEYFTLASQGFKFSPEISKKYEAFYGPKIKEIITREEINDLVSLKKALEKNIDISY